MSRKRQSKRSSFGKQILVFLLVVIFLYPAVSTFDWLHAVAIGNDPRKVLPVEVLAVREIDKNQAAIKPLEEPLITVTFDDGWENIYSNGYPLLQKYGVTTTQYILGDEFSSANYMSVNQVAAMQKTGHDIASHTMNHPDLTKLGGKDLNWQLKESKSTLSQDFGPIKDFASPLGSSNQQTLEAISQYYRSNRNTVADPAILDETDINTARNFNRFNINAYTVRKTTSLEDIRKLIEYNEQQKGWLVLTYHQIGDSDSFYGITEKTFEDQLKIINTSRSRLATIDKVLDILAPENEVTF